MDRRTWKAYFWIILIGGLFFIPFLGGVHLFDWDEINFAEISREMLLQNEYSRIYIDFQPFWEKPPFFFWLQSSSMLIFGVNEFAARFPNAICGILTLLLLFQIGKQIFDKKFAWIWVLAYGGSILPHLYFKSGIIDPWFNLFIFSGLYLFILFHWKKNKFENIYLKYNKWQYLIFGGLLLGFAILTKGQAAYIIACLAFFVYWVKERFRFFVNVPEFLLFTFAASLVTLSWYGWETMKNGTWFIVEFNKYQYRLFSTPDAGHGGFPGYHFVVLLAGCFPASIFAIRSFFKMPTPEFSYQKDFIFWMKNLFWVVLILFSIVQSKIVHYSSMCYFPLTFLAAVVIKNILDGEIIFSKKMKLGIVGIATIFILAVFATPFLGKNVEWLQSKINDRFAVANLDAEVIWTGWEIVPAIFMLGILWGSFRFFRQENFYKGFSILFFGTAIFLQLTLFFFIGKIENYTQRTAIEFFKSLEGRDVYVRNIGYKSYAPFFYTKKMPPQNEKSYDKNWLLRGEIDRDVFFITKIHQANALRKIDGVEEVFSKNGFVVFKRLGSPSRKDAKF